MAGLKRELQERFPDSEILTMEELAVEFGPADETADALLESVPREGQWRYHARWKRRAYLVIAGFALLLAASAALFIYTERNQTVRAEQNIIVHTTIYEGSE